MKTAKYNAIFMAAMSLLRKLTLIPVLGLLLCSYLMTELGVTNWTRFAEPVVIRACKRYCNRPKSAP